MRLRLGGFNDAAAKRRPGPGATERDRHLDLGAGRDDLERASISRLLREALSAGWITNDEFADIDKAREIRNSFTHFRRPLHDEGLERRALDRAEHPYALIEEDARNIIQIVYQVLARNAT